MPDTPTPCTVPQCVNPARNGFVCDSCVWALLSDLRGIPDVKADLLVTYTRQDVGDRQPSGRTETEPPLLYRPDAADADAELNGVLHAWCRHLAGVLGLTMRDVLPVRTDMSVAPGPWMDDRHEWVTRAAVVPHQDTLELARWLERHSNDIRIAPEAGQIIDEIGNAVARVRRATDRPPNRLYLGPCECEHETGRQVDLYARPDAARVTCWNCAAVWNVDERRDWLLTQSSEVLVTAEMASRALPRLVGQDLTPDLIRRMRDRDGLTAYPPMVGDPHRRAMYRVGDIVRVLTERAAAIARRQTGLRAPAPPTDGLPPELAGLFEAARRSAAAGRPLVADPGPPPPPAPRGPVGTVAPDGSIRQSRLASAVGQTARAVRLC